MRADARTVVDSYFLTALTRMIPVCHEVVASVLILEGSIELNARARPMKCGLQNILIAVFAGIATTTASGQAPFVSLEMSSELAVPPEPVTPSSFSIQAVFVPDSRIAPAIETIVLGFFPPEPVVPPDPINPRATDWRLSFFPGCFVEQRSGQFRVQDYRACGAALVRSFDDGTRVDLTNRILFLDADIKPPTGKQTEWRFRADLEFEVVPPEPIFPPEPVRGGTVLSIGDDFGEAINSRIGWDSTTAPSPR
jgi:hypothetical protein